MSGPASPFFPNSVSGMLAWYDFSDITSLWQTNAFGTPVTADGQTIKSVTDRATFTTYTGLTEATNGPTFKTGIVNSKSVARFDGVNDTLATPDSRFVFGTGCTVLAVAKTTGNGYMLSATGDRLFYQGVTTAAYQFGGSNDVGYTIAQSADNVSASFQVIAGTWDTTLTTNETNIWVAGALGTHTANNANNTGNLQAVRISLGSTPTPAAFWAGDIAEVIIYNGVLSAAQINIPARYLASKYALTWTNI